MSLLRPCLPMTAKKGVAGSARLGLTQLLYCRTDEATYEDRGENETLSLTLNGVINHFPLFNMYTVYSRRYMLVPLRLQFA